MSQFEKALLKKISLDKAREHKSGTTERTSSLGASGVSAPIRRPKQSISIDFEDLRAKGVLAPADDMDRISEQYRRIKRPILSLAFGKGKVESGNIAMVGSAFPGEGKTYTSFNLALGVVVERDKTVLLIDADVAKQRLTHSLGLDGKPGLMDLLTDDTLMPEDVTFETDIPGLSVIPAGEYHKLATELMGSARMEHLMKEISDRSENRLVLFDSPPFLATTEALALNTHVGQVIFVVEALKTPQKAVLEALGTIDTLKPTSLILNKLSYKSGANYYGGYHGYGA